MIEIRRSGTSALVDFGETSKEVVVMMVLVLGMSTEMVLKLVLAFELVFVVELKW